MMTQTSATEGGSEAEEEQEVGDTQGTLITFIRGGRENTIGAMECKPPHRCRN